MNFIKTMTIVCGLGLALASCSNAPKSEQGEFKYIADEFADLQILRYQIPGWESLSLDQKALIYHDSSAVCFFGNQMDGVTVEPFAGREYRTNEIQAAILREQLK